MAAALITASATVLVAVVGGFVAHWSSRRLDQRREQLKRVNRQLSELYGPLLSALEATRIAHDRFQDWYGIPEERDRDLWKAWLETYYQPANRIASDLIATKADLLVDSEVPPFLLELCALTARYDVLLALWKEGSEEGPTKQPVEVSGPYSMAVEYARERFRELKEEQEALLSKVRVGEEGLLSRARGRTLRA
jgi:hypothetical protein